MPINQQNSKKARKPKRLMDQVAIRYPCHQQLLKLFKELLEKNDDFHQQKCFAVGGPSRVGKSICLETVPASLTPEKRK